MAEEPNNLDNNNEEQLVPISRINELSKKIGKSEKDKQELSEAKQALEAERNQIAKERDFYQSFVDSTSQYPQARDFKDKIKEKVLAGYTVEDATVAVLVKEGKLTSPPPEKQVVAGGSATNSSQATGPKSLSEMTREEKRKALLEQYN